MATIMNISAVAKVAPRVRALLASSPDVVVVAAVLVFLGPIRFRSHSTRALRETRSRRDARSREDDATARDDATAMSRRPRARGRIARGVASRARRARPPASSRAKSATAFADAFSRYASFPDRAQAQLRSKSTAALRATKPVVVAKAAFRVNAAAVRLPTRFPRFASREDARDRGARVD